MSGNLPAGLSDSFSCDGRKSKDPSELYAGGIRNIVFGVGFAVISLALAISGVAGGRSWWWAMLFPAVSFLAKGISDCVRYSKIAPQAQRIAEPYVPQLSQPYTNLGLPPTRTDYVARTDVRYETGDLVPPSVTDSTTRHLEMNPECATMASPKK